MNETILQFGAGNFLRAFVDAFVHEANGQGQEVGRIVVVQSTPGPRAQLLNEQEGRYHVVTRGLVGGQLIDRVDEVASISRALVAAEEWEQVLEVARSPALRWVVSNTTESGFVLDPAEKAPGDGTPRSFAAKLAVVLESRFAAGLEPLTIMPCELFDDNGGCLRQLVLEQAAAWGWSGELVEWIEGGCRWVDSLVDRIVSGYPADHPLAATDRLLAAAEPFRLWVMQGQGDETLLCRHPDMQVVSEVAPYSLRKVRLLNGAHTALVGHVRGMDFTTVRQALADEAVKGWLEELIFKEIIPVVEERVEGARAFAEEGLERFANPFLDHRLADIALHHESKIETRLLPTYREYEERFGRRPPLLHALLEEQH
ncbi:MAG: altronate dehydrogenase [Candidatus Latescibacteria bacterium]|nr:altronate dehydrogenase [Candidatus Latescibacterota bacterium]